MTRENRKELVAVIEKYLDDIKLGGTVNHHIIARMIVSIVERFMRAHP